MNPRDPIDDIKDELRKIVRIGSEVSCLELWHKLCGRLGRRALSPGDVLFAAGQLSDEGFGKVSRMGRTFINRARV